MQDYSVHEVVEQAILTERLGRLFYLNMRDRFSGNEALCSLFTALANKEAQHEKTFAGLKEILDENASEEWAEVRGYLRAVVESEFFLGKAKALPSMQEIENEADAVDFALSFEKETLLYFIGLKDAVTEKGVIEEIINEEKNHVVWLSALKQTLVTQRPGAAQPDRRGVI